MKKTKGKRRLVVPASEMWSELYRTYDRHLRERDGEPRLSCSDRLSQLDGDWRAK